MNPERWRLVAELFEAAADLPRDGRERLLEAEGRDPAVVDEVRRLLAHDERAERDGFLEPPAPERTASWGLRPTHAPEGSPASPATPRRGFTPYDAIQSAPEGSQPSIGTRDVARRRLSGLTTTCIVITLLILVWKYAIVRDPDASQAVPYVLLIAGLGGLLTTLRGLRFYSPGHLEMMELGMIGAVAAVYSFAQYQTMLDFSQRSDPMRAQLVLNHRILISTILILSYGIYAPTSWKRAAAVLAAIALLPFATLLLLRVVHPEAMGWMRQMGLERGSTPVAHFGFDAMLLLILAAWAAHGAYTITRLRRQEREARKLGQYQLKRPLGSGGMGEVYLAEHKFLKRPCALKLIKPGFGAGTKTLERFEREVSITAGLSHPNTIDVYDYGRTEDGEYFYVMEYLPGLSLDELVRRHGPLPPGRVVHLLRQVCNALTEAHSAGLVHRDIKPSNVFATRRGGVDDVAKLLDFGLVRPVADPRSPDLSDEGQILGTPTYMSPEQATGGREVDGRSDVYSLGAVAFQLLTGSPPFERGGAIEVLIAVARDPAPPPSRLQVDVPPDLDRVVLRCLAKSPAERFQDVRDLERALAACGCAGDWDADRAARWWREHEPAAMK